MQRTRPLMFLIAALGLPACSREDHAARPPQPRGGGATSNIGGAIASAPTTVIKPTAAAVGGATGTAIGPDDIAPAAGAAATNAGRPAAPEAPPPNMPTPPANPVPTLPEDPAVIDWKPGGECPKNVSCGGTVCSTESINPTGIGMSQNLCTPACCTARNTCGIRVLTSMTANADSTCTELEQVGVATAECGAAEEMLGDMGVPLDPSGLLNFPIVGCCRPDNRCGLFLPNLGAGCVALDDIKNITPLFALIDIPRMPCTYPSTVPGTPGLN